MALKPQRSLKARALQWLAQREQSRAELRRKLMPHARAEFSAQEEIGRERDDAALGEPAVEGWARAGSTPVSARSSSDLPAAPPLSPEARVDAVLDWLEAHQYLSQTRFVESRVHARAPRFGNLRIRQELKQHQAVLSPQAAQALKDSELQRAEAVRSRKFSTPPGDTTERARQWRFLLGRGFTPEVVWRALREIGSATRETEADVGDGDGDRDDGSQDHGFRTDTGA